MVKPAEPDTGFFEFNGLSSDILATLQREEDLRGERFAWIFHWALYGLVVVFLLVVHFYQKSPVGTWGLGLITIALALNGFVSRRILERRPTPWLRYVYTLVDLTFLTLYNALDTYYNSTLTPVTTATLLLYPIILFLAALQNDRRLIVLATLYCVLAMNILFTVAYPLFDPRIAPKLVCGNIECQVYRTGYILLFGGLLLIFPSTLSRLLNKQKLLFEQNMEQFALAHHDTLTGLANRRLFIRFMEKVLPLARRHKHQFAILYMDLDGFKAVNDTKGHDAGDQILQEVASRLLTVVRDSDLVARFGGDEFVVIAQRIEGREGAQVLAGRILSALHAPFLIQSDQIQLGASIGIALYPDDAEDGEQLIQLADDALYLVKKNGKNSSAFPEPPSVFQ
ncbi:MAG TPA: GGDEF domain-containing protein [Fibrobacteria bacterium]|nr:GGDEF domain-containing protein [Fibrobacteria bacterium]